MGISGEVELTSQPKDISFNTDDVPIFLVTGYKLNLELWLGWAISCSVVLNLDLNDILRPNLRPYKPPVLGAGSRNRNHSGVLNCERPKSIHPSPPFWGPLLVSTLDLNMKLKTTRPTSTNKMGCTWSIRFPFPSFFFGSSSLHNGPVIWLDESSMHTHVKVYKYNSYDRW